MTGSSALGAGSRSSKKSSTRRQSQGLHVQDYADLHLRQLLLAAQGLVRRSQNLHSWRFCLRHGMLLAWCAGSGQFTCHRLESSWQSSLDSPSSAMSAWSARLTDERGGLRLMPVQAAGSAARRFRASS